MPAADAAWLHMDRPVNPMVVNSVIWFDAPLDWELVKGIISRRIVDQFPRFRRRVGDPLGRPPRFEDDSEFDIEQHLHRLALPAPGDQAALQELVSDLITPPLDPTRPLWHAYLIEGYGNGCAILFRIHHCIADGIALARVMLSLTDRWIFSPAALRDDLSGPRRSPSYLLAASELLDHAADLLTESAALVHGNERRWRVFAERVSELRSASDCG